MDIGSTSKYGGNPHSAALLLLLHTTVPQQLAKHDRSLDRSLDWSDRAGEPMGSRWGASRLQRLPEVDTLPHSSVGRHPD